MKRWRVHLCAALVVPAAMMPAPAFAQATQPSDDPELSADDSSRLQRHRQIIENTDDSLGTRQVQAEELLMTGWPAATDTAVELLGAGADPSTRIAVCQAVASVGRSQPALLSKRHARLVDPLIGLLGDAAEGVSARAAEALAAFPDGGVTARLGALAADESAPMRRRLAAVDALAMSVYRRDVVRQLVLLLPGKDPEFQVRVLKSLRPASRQDFGDDIAQWQAWWERQEASLSEADWMLERVKLFFGRLRESQRRLEEFRTEQERRYAALAGRLTDLVREHYRLLQQPGQKEEALTRWLTDAQVEFRLAALAIISEQIQEGTLPSDAVVAVVINELSHRSPDVRRAALGIVGALTVPANTGAVLALLKEEKEVSVRQTAFRVLGQLRSPEVIPTLIREIDIESNRTAPSGCVAEAARALAIVGAKGKVDPALVAPAIPVLEDRFAETPPADLHLRASLLRAMASIGAAEFAGTFNDSLSFDQAELLLPAIDGLVVLGDAGNIDRLRTLTGHADPRVREAAVKAVGILGHDAAHLEALTARLSPSAEPSEAVRNAAWTAWCRILGGKTPAVRLEWADRLRGMPERHAAYLDTLVKDLAKHNQAPPELKAARRQLATLYAERGQPAAALPIWQKLYASLEAAGDPQAPDVGIAVVSAGLACGRHEAVTEMLQRFSTADPAVKTRVCTVVTEFVNAQQAKGETDELPALVDAVLAAPLDEYDEAFLTSMQDAKQKLAGARPTATSPVTTSPAPPSPEGTSPEGAPAPAPQD
ncbi:MAG: hypothetical protein JSV19_09695 [Phycisphaerales bacterium]|nr:MAG: hypothetical protein JSV19_09695 [Phycisphaerales bacterium]